MKYFVNNPYTAETLKNEFRELSKKLHPDTGGNAEEFKEMLNEYETAARNLSGTKQSAQSETQKAAEEARRREKEERAKEEKKRREKEEAEEAERIRKAQEINREAVRAWSAILERIPENLQNNRRYYGFDSKKDAAAFLAITKRNIKAVINHYFPGLKVSISISGAIWKEKFEISWQDGPGVDIMRETAKELRFFVPSYYVSDPYADYGNYEDNAEFKPWREAYGQAFGNCTEYELKRVLSEEGKQQAEEAANAIFKNWHKDDDHGRGTFTATFAEWCKFAELLGCPRNQFGLDFYSFGLSWHNYVNYETEEDGHEVGAIYFSSIRRVMREKFNAKTQPREKAPEFVPVYGPIYKAIKKALAGNVFYIIPDGDNSEPEELNIFEAAKKLTKGEPITLGQLHTTCDGGRRIYGVSRGGVKVQNKRAAKFAEVGIILEGANYHIYRAVHAVGINKETADALRKESEEIAEQRTKWEEKQKTSTATTGSRKDASKRTAPESANGSENGEKLVIITNPTAAGLSLEEIPGGVAIVGSSRDTWKARKSIKAHGAKWNRNRGQWEATDAAAVEDIRKWFEPLEAPQEAAKPEPEPAKPESEPETATAADKAAEDLNEASGDTAPEIAQLFEAFADFFGVLATICSEAKKFEGVTVPPATLERWKKETADQSKTTAARLAEVCACLGSLTPDARADFDALGVIFWTLSEQLRNGLNADTIAPAVEYARAQLFELIERTQNRNQANAVKDANEGPERAAA